MIFYDKTPAFIITLMDDKKSIQAANKCIKSIRDTKSEIIPFLYPAIDRTQVSKLMRKYKLDYTFPIGVPFTEPQSNLLLHPYKTNDLLKRIGCFFSHFTLWEFISEQDPREIFIILEQDTLFIEQFRKMDFIPVDDAFICGLNSPLNATRKAALFDLKLKAMFQEHIKSNTDEDIYTFFELPWIDESNIPQGLAGNSAYAITRDAAIQLIDKVYEYGIWPNDAIMCRQILGEEILYTAYPYITKVQNNKSTTSL